MNNEVHTNNNQNQMQLNDYNNSKYIDKRTGTGYVSASSNTMDFPILVVLITLVVTIIGGIFLVASNSEFLDTIDEAWDSFVEEIIDDFEYDDVDDYDVEYDEYDTYDMSEQVVIRPNQIFPLSLNKTIVVWIGRPHYVYSIEHAKEMIKLKNNYNVDVYHINSDDLITYGDENVRVVNEYQYNILTNLKTASNNKFDISTYEFTGHPLTLVIYNNQIVEDFPTFTDYRMVSDVLIKYGITRK